MRRLALAFSFVVSFLLTIPSAHASLVVQIDKSRQRMTVLVDGQPRYSWLVSTGRNGFGTPSGTYRPQRLARTWFSRKYYNSPMPHSIFFHNGFAIHGSYEIRRLGGPASHGCVRLHPAHAAVLYGLVQREGSANTRIVVSGQIHTAAAVAAGRGAAATSPARPRIRWEFVPYDEPPRAYRPAPRPYDPPRYRPQYYGWDE
jgi:lipoprotein-anchoring transpeptidase ErfK/SrfK